MYNQERPHEALAMATPASCYEPSSRRFPGRLPQMEYPADFARRRVQLKGAIEWRRGRLFLGEALEGETGGIEEVEDGWRIWFGPLPLARLDARQISNPKAKRDKRCKGRWRAQLWDSSGRPAGSRRRPTTSNGSGNRDSPSHGINP
jgi:hypothetical protein